MNTMRDTMYLVAIRDIVKKIELFLQTCFIKKNLTSRQRIFIIYFIFYFIWFIPTYIILYNAVLQADGVQDKVIEQRSCTLQVI